MAEIIQLAIFLPLNHWTPTIHLTNYILHLLTGTDLLLQVLGWQGRRLTLDWKNYHPNYIAAMLRCGGLLFHEQQDETGSWSYLLLQWACNYFTFSFRLICINFWPNLHLMTYKKLLRLTCDIEIYQIKHAFNHLINQSNSYPAW